MEMEKVGLCSIEDGIEIVEVVVESNIEYIVGKIKDILDFYHRNLTILMTKMDFNILGGSVRQGRGVF